MTPRELVTLVLRRWYMFAIGAALSLAGVYGVMHRDGVYYTQFNVVLLAPTEEYFLNRIEDPHHALAPLAGLIAADWNGSNRPLFTASGDTTLFGEGRRSGVQVRVPNQGSQWQPAYLSPVINVQVVDESQEVVTATAQRVTAELTALLQERQESAGVRESMRVTLISAPEVPTVDYITGSRTRATGATALAGGVATFVAVYWTDRWLRRRRSTADASPMHLDGTDDNVPELVGDPGWR